MKKTLKLFVAIFILMFFVGCNRKTANLPDLTGKSQAEIIETFKDVKETLGEKNVTLNFKYLYPTSQKEDIFVSYGNDLKAGDSIKKGAKVDIEIIGNYLEYQNIENKTEVEIKTIYEELFKDYITNYEVVFLDYYDFDNSEGTLLGYPEDIKAGDKIEDLRIVVRKSFYETLRLPDLKGLTIDEIETLISLMNLPSNRVNLAPYYSEYVNAGQFIKYEVRNEELKAGDVININDNPLYIYYDMRPYLRDFHGYNKKQIENEIVNVDANFTFEYTLNNNKEYDTFAGYKNLELGEEITPGMNVVINLYKNDDVNVEDEINVLKQLFISKYISGRDKNLGIEIFNPTDEDILLDDYYIALIAGRQLTPDVIIPLTGTLKSKEAYAIVNNGASVDLLFNSDLQTSLMDFGANTTIQLRRVANDTYIDTIYDLANSSTFLDREIFVRKESVTHGRRNFVYTEWKSFVPEFLEIVGTHPYDGAEDPVFELIADKTFQEYGMTKVKYLSAADGDTVYFESLDPRDTTNYGGNNRIRFLIVDTPETQKPGQIGEPYAKVATNFTVNMLTSASEIYLQASVEGGITDTYGRHLGLIWANVGTPSSPNWKLLNYELLKAGLGIVFIAKTGEYYNHPIFGNRYLYSWAQEADNYARENKLGLYSGVHRD